MKKRTLLLLITLLIVLILYIFLYLLKPEAEKPAEDINLGETIIKVSDRNNYYMIKNCVNKFYSYYASIFENKNPEEEDIKRTYNLLDEQYIGFYNITEENLATILPAINESVVNIYNMYVSNQGEGIFAYIVKGNLREEKSKKISDFEIMVKIDIKNQTFSVLLQDYLKIQYPNINLGDNLRIEKLNNIKINRNNLYVLEEISDQTHVINLFDNYKEEILYNTQLAYEHLDIKYKSAKFGNLMNFTQYSVKNKEYIINSMVEQYQMESKNGYVQYVCIDSNGRYYIFREKDLMSYTLILDNYTIDLPEFLEKYNRVNVVKKVGYNIQKCLDAINCKDYLYVYNKLYFEFKAINYPTIEEFETKIKSKLFNRNKVKEVSSFYEGETHIFKLVITDVNDNTKEQPMTVIMQLKEGTEFVMSFSFQ